MHRGGAGETGAGTAAAGAGTAGRWIF